jgi:tRNA(Arg) A34 adenosine deaminase TadA
MQLKFMEKAIRLAAFGMQSNRGGPFGCVIVKNGEIIAEGTNQVTSAYDPTAHAEMVAIRNACKNLEDFQLTGCDIYTSCEPCPMCLGAIYWARPERVFYAASRRDAADAGFDDEFIYKELDKQPKNRAIPMKSLLRKEARKLFEEWKLKEDKIEY